VKASAAIAAANIASFRVIPGLRVEKCLGVRLDL